MNLTSVLGPDALGYTATPGFEPLRCRIPSYAQKYDVECFEMFRRLPTFTFYLYKLILAANVFFLAFFSLSLLGFLGVAVHARGTARGRATAVFTAVMCLGNLCEAAGYAARVRSYRNRGAEAPFLTQIICLSIGPAFTAAGLYVCVRRLAEVFGARGASLVRPRWYTRGFIAADAAALVTQGAGGGLVGTAMRAGRDKQPGTRVMVAGMALQVATLLVFLLLAAHFAWTAGRRHRARAAAAAALDPDGPVRRPPGARRFRGFLAALVLSAVCLFFRCIYRVAELSQGWTGPIMKRQDLFITFEGVMVALSVLGLNVFHPALCMGHWPESHTSDSEEAIEK